MEHLPPLFFTRNRNRRDRIGVDSKRSGSKNLRRTSPSVPPPRACPELVEGLASKERTRTWGTGLLSVSPSTLKMRLRGSSELMTEHKIGLMIGEYRAFIERIAWYSVGVVNLLADVDRQSKTMADVIGTGTACMWEGHNLILTAEHVIDKAEPRNLAFLLRVDDAINWEGMGRPEEVVPRVSLPVEGIVRCKEHDLAAIVLRADDLASFRMQFCELPKQALKESNAQTRRVSHSSSAIRRIEYFLSQRPVLRMLWLTITRSDRPYSQGQSQSLHRKDCHPSTTQSAMC